MTGLFFLTIVGLNGGRSFAAHTLDYSLVLGIIRKHQDDGFKKLTTSFNDRRPELWIHD